MGGRLESFEEANAEANEANTPVTFDCRHPSHVYLVSDRRSQITDHNHMHMHVHMTRSHHTTLPQQHTTATTTMPQRLDDDDDEQFFTHSSPGTPAVATMPRMGKIPPPKDTPTEEEPTPTTPSSSSASASSSTTFEIPVAELGSTSIPVGTKVVVVTKMGMEDEYREVGCIVPDSVGEIRVAVSSWTGAMTAQRQSGQGEGPLLTLVALANARSHDSVLETLVLDLTLVPVPHDYAERVSFPLEAIDGSYPGARGLYFACDSYGSNSGAGWMTSKIIPLAFPLIWPRGGEFPESSSLWSVAQVLKASVGDVRDWHLPSPQADGSHLYLDAPVSVSTAGWLGESGPAIKGRVVWMGKRKGRGVVCIESRTDLIHLYGLVLRTWSGEGGPGWFASSGYLGGVREAEEHISVSSSGRFCFVASECVALDVNNQGALSQEDFVGPRVASPCPNVSEGCRFVGLPHLVAAHLNKDCVVRRLPEIDIWAGHSQDADFLHRPRPGSGADGKAPSSSSPIVNHRQLATQINAYARLWTHTPFSRWGLDGAVEAAGVWVLGRDGKPRYLAGSESEFQILSGHTASSSSSSRASRASSSARSDDRPRELSGPFSTLPVELLMTILSFANVRTITAVGTTCRYFDWLISDPYLWRMKAQVSFGASVSIGPYKYWGGWKTLVQDENRLNPGPPCSNRGCGAPVDDTDPAAAAGMEAAGRVRQRAAGRSDNSKDSAIARMLSALDKDPEWTFDAATGIAVASWAATETAHILSAEYDGDTGVLSVPIPGFGRVQGPDLCAWQDQVAPNMYSRQGVRLEVLDHRVRRVSHESLFGGDVTGWRLSLCRTSSTTVSTIVEYWILRT